MGLLRFLRNLTGTDKEVRILILGLDNAGKLSLVQRLSEEHPNRTEPTAGFKLYTVSQRGFKLNTWDIGTCDDHTASLMI